MVNCLQLIQAGLYEHHEGLIHEPCEPMSLRFARRFYSYHSEDAANGKIRNIRSVILYYVIRDN